MRAVLGALQIARDERCGLLLHHGERRLWQRGSQLIVGEQLDPARKIVLEDGEGKAVARGLAGGNVVERLAESEPVEGPGAVGVK